jgi:dTDP-4-dehydrorhamnose reductase
VAWALRRGDRVRLFTDQFRTPVDAEAVAGALGALLRGAGSGRYHLGGPERVSRHELGWRVAALLGLSAEAIEPVTQQSFFPGAVRPADVSLDSTRARRELGFEPRGLDAMILSGRSAPL